MIIIMDNIWLSPIVIIKKNDDASDFGPAGQHRSAPAASGTKCDEEVDPGPFRGRRDDRDGRWIWFTGCFFPTRKKC